MHERGWLFACHGEVEAFLVTRAHFCYGRGPLLTPGMRNYWKSRQPQHHPVLGGARCVGVERGVEQRLDRGATLVARIGDEVQGGVRPRLGEVPSGSGAPSRKRSWASGKNIPSPAPRAQPAQVSPRGCRNAPSKSGGRRPHRACRDRKARWVERGRLGRAAKVVPWVAVLRSPTLC